MNDQIWMFLVGEVITAVGIYAAIRSDLRELQVKAVYIEKDVEKIQVRVSTVEKEVERLK